MTSHQNVIDQLNKMQGLKIECADCQNTFSVQRAKLFSVKENLPDKIAKIIANTHVELENQLENIKEEKRSVRTKKKDKPKRIKITAEAVNFGKIVEKIVPSFDNFPYEPKDCRALYEPIDYIVFGNYSKTGKCDFIVFTDVKSGNAKLEDNQKQIRRIVNSNKVKIKVFK